MTGFGRGEATVDDVTITVEARSVNHRHLDIALRLPPALAGFEPDARRLVQGRVERGRVEVTVVVGRPASQPAQEVRVDVALARRYLTQARALAAELGLAGEPPLAWVLERPGVLRLEEAALPEAGVLWAGAATALGRALDELLARRAAEGAALASGLRALLAELRGLTEAMTTRAPLAAARRGERLRERLRGWLGEVPVDEARVLTEVAVWAQKADVTEELTRVRAHLDELAAMLDKGGPVGRPMDFLLQELNREITTTAAKADDLELAQAALAAKAVLEKMREQAQNLE